MRIPERIRTWRRDAAVFRDYGDARTADVLERLTAQLEDDLEEDASEIVDMARAVQLTGYTRGHLRRPLLAGTLRNVGTPENPAFHISDLPRKPGHASPRPRPRRPRGCQAARGSLEDPSRPVSIHVLNLWLQRAKDRAGLKVKGLGFHAQKRAGVRRKEFRELPPKVQEALTGTNHETLRKVYDDVSLDEMRETVERLSAPRRRRTGGDQMSLGLTGDE